VIFALKNQSNPHPLPQTPPLCLPLFLALPYKLNFEEYLPEKHQIHVHLQRYLHNNIESLRKKTDKQTGQGLIVTDAVFSMDGDQADMGALDKIAQKSKAILMQDDAHGFGVFQANIPQNSIYMATLGKAAGTMGAFVAGDGDLIDFLVPPAQFVCLFFFSEIQYYYVNNAEGVSQLNDLHQSMKRD
jgi:hypothetical protein